MIIDDDGGHLFTLIRLMTTPSDSSREGAGDECKDSGSSSLLEGSSVSVGSPSSSSVTMTTLEDVVVSSVVVEVDEEQEEKVIDASDKPGLSFKLYTRSLDSCCNTFTMLSSLVTLLLLICILA